jgi:hypothetical protein
VTYNGVHRNSAVESLVDQLVMGRGDVLVIDDAHRSQVLNWRTSQERVFTMPVCRKSSFGFKPVRLALFVEDVFLLRK